MLLRNHAVRSAEGVAKIIDDYVHSALRAATRMKSSYYPAWSHTPRRHEAMLETGLGKDHLGDLLRLSDNALRIGPMGKAPVPVDHLAIHQHHTRIAALPGIDEARNGTVGHAHVWLREVENRNVGALARLERADLLVHAERRGGVDGCHLDCTFGRHPRRIEMAHVLHERTRLHLLHHVDRIIDHRAVRAERDGDAGALRIGDWTDPAAADRLARRRVHE